MSGPDLMGLYALSGSGTGAADPAALRRSMIVQQLMNGASNGDPTSSPAAGANHIAQGLLAGALMHNQGMGGGWSNIANGLSNWASGYGWNGMAGQGMQQNLQAQANANIAAGAGQPGVPPL